MLNLKNVLLSFCFAVYIVVPNSSEAFKTVDQRAIWLNEDTYLYTVAYEFGFLNRELKMPISAIQGLSFDSSKYAVGYSFLEGGVINDSFISNAVVLSNASIVDGEYVVPRGKRERFTLVVVGKTKAFLESGLSVKVTALPLKLVDNGELSEVKTSEEQLEDYVTPALRK